MKFSVFYNQRSKHSMFQDVDGLGTNIVIEAPSKAEALLKLLGRKAGEGSLIVKVKNENGEDEEVVKVSGKMVDSFFYIRESETIS